MVYVIARRNRIVARKGNLRQVKNYLQEQMPSRNLQVYKETTGLSFSELAKYRGAKTNLGTGKDYLPIKKSAIK